MIVTYNWLKDFVDFDFSPDALSHRLTMAGLEVDAMEILGEGLDSVIVAQLLSVEKHPGADKLTLCQVDTGSEQVQIVCGATNHRKGDRVALAQVGTVLPGDFKIKKSKIRGEVSMGMLCSESELGLAEASEGIMILPEDLSLGTPVFEALGLKDVRYEIGLTPNRPDCLSVYGVAREVAAMAQVPLKKPQILLEEGGEAADKAVSVRIDDAERCPRYAARLIRGVEVGPSPEWLVRRLESVGQRSINNVVDVTNYVLMELGHPLHAFDYRLLEGGEIRVRCAGDMDVFTTLDEQERELTSEDLMICDAKQPVALAGIMGGLNSEVNDQTRDVLLESAYFSPVGIRRSSKRLGLHTEASHRFERGADIDMVPLALDRAAALIAEVSGGTVAPGVVDEYPRVLEPRELKLTLANCERILGFALAEDRIVELLSSIGLDVEQGAEGSLGVRVPLFRPDLEREIDLIEEVARLNGYDNIPVTMPEGSLQVNTTPEHLLRIERLRQAVAASGCNETISYSFIAPGAWDRLQLAADDPRRLNVAILNPLSEDQSVMRTSLVPSMLESVSRNLSHRSLDLRLFELRPVFSPTGSDLPEESYRLAVAFCGRRYPEAWSQSDQTVDFFDLKGFFERLCEAFLLEGVRYERSAGESFLHPGKSCLLKIDDKVLGTLGEVHPSVMKAFDIDSTVYLLDLDVEAFFGAARQKVTFSPISRYPDVSRDSALLVDEQIPAQEILDLLQKSRTKEVEEIQIFDVYQGQGIAEGKKSVGIRVRYRSPDKTLTDNEVVRYHGKLIDRLCRAIGAEVR